MTVLAKKEVRLLAPGWLAVLLLEVAIPWLGNGEEWTLFFGPLTLFFGMVILGVDSFGGEFTRNTFLSLMAQPVERRTIWRTKITVLAAAAGVIFLAYVASYELWMHWPDFAKDTHNQNDLGRLAMTNWENWGYWLSGSFIAMAIALSGGLWTSLLLRQAAPAFWISMLTPAAIFLGLVLVIPEKWSANNTVVLSTLYGLALIYSVNGFWLACRLFYRAQDVTWTGGVVNFSRWRYFESRSVPGASRRQSRPLRALLKKELQLHSISLFCTGAILATHVCIILFRAYHGHFGSGSLWEVTSDQFWFFWLILPLLIGCMAIAEERKLGVTEAQFCLPLSRRIQFVLKIFPALFFGVLLGGFMPVGLELLAAGLGFPNEYFRPMFTEHGGFKLAQADYIWVISSGLLVILPPLALTLAGIYASSISANFLQALGAGVLTLVSGVMLFWGVKDWNHFAGIELNPGITLVLLALSVPFLLTWLAYGNYRFFKERGRLWLRNTLGLGLGFLFICTVSAGLHNRVWDTFEPAEATHGTARLTLAHPPKIQVDWTTLQVWLPDGQIYVDGVMPTVEKLPQSGWAWHGIYIKALCELVFSSLPNGSGLPAKLPGTNWVSVAAHFVDYYLPAQKDGRPFGQRETGLTSLLAIKNDGTLWTPTTVTNVFRANDSLHQIGTATNWSQVSIWGYGALLLKTDGTLWSYGSPSNNWVWEPRQPVDLRQFKLSQIEFGTNWDRLCGGVHRLGHRTDGSVWFFEKNYKTLQMEWKHLTNLDKVNWENYSYTGDEGIATIHPDGSLWTLEKHQNDESTRAPSFFQCGQETNWVSVAIKQHLLVGLKSDGSIWSWSSTAETPFNWSQLRPNRLSIYNDWVAINNMNGGVVALAADGGLWLWPDAEGEGYYYTSPIKMSHHPKFLGNVFAGQNQNAKYSPDNFQAKGNS